MKALIIALILSLLLPIQAIAFRLDLEEITQTYTVAGEMTIGDVLTVKGYYDYLQDIPEVIVIASPMPEGDKAVIMYAFECQDGWHCYTYGKLENSEGFGYARASLGATEIERLDWLKGLLFGGRGV